MKRGTLGVILLVLGLLAVFMALGADLVGLGSKGVFGWRQLWGALAGVVIATAGALALARQS